MSSRDLGGRRQRLYTRGQGYRLKNLTGALGEALGNGSPHNQCLRAQRAGNEKTLWYRVDIQNRYLRPFKVHFSQIFDPV